VLADHVQQITRSFGLGGRVLDFALAARGMQGRVWRLDTDEGSWAVKELLVRQTEPDAAADVAYQEAALSAGTVVMPHPVRTGRDTVLLELGGHQVRAYGWVDLLPADQSLDPELVGATLAAVHRIGHRGTTPLHPWYSEAVGRARWVELLKLAEAASAPFVDGFAAEIPQLVELEAFLERPTHPQTCHRDLWADNLLPTPAGEICVIDWENSGLADPSHEIPMVLLDFASGDPRRVGRIYQTYCACGGPARVRGRGAFTMVIAQFGHFWESAVTSYLKVGATPEDQSRSLDRIAELLGTALRTEHIDEVLDTLATPPGRR
jgi:Ser/Thr protein kinase RdoA (MazF antagonist)